MIEKTGHLRRHAGQVAFPGGRIEAGESPVQAALREASEEIGLDPLEPDVLGALPPIHTRVSGFLVVPWVAALPTAPVLAASDHEIEAIVELPIARLGAAERSMELPVDGGRTWTFPNPEAPAGMPRTEKVVSAGGVELEATARRDALRAQASSGRSLKRIEKSTAVTSLISAPTEMRSTPVSA